MRWTTLRRRLARANTALLLAGLGLLAVSVTRAGLSLGGVSVSTLGSVGAQVGAGAFGLLLITASFIVGVEPAQPPGVDELADLLAAEVLRQWTRAASDRRLEVPAPIPVKWIKSRLAVAGPIREAVGSLRDPPRFPPLPGLERVTGARLRSGQLRDLHRVYGGLQSGRLVLLGSPGSGKSAAAVLLLLDALRHRQQVSGADRRSVPVPVLLTLRDWDPGTQRIESWLVDRMAQTYRLFAGRGGVADAEALVVAERIAVILDGLDEIPRELRSTALRALTEQATFRVVVLTRSAEMVSATEEGHFVGAAALELEPVEPRAAADYLQRVQLEPPPAGWRELIKHLRDDPGGPMVLRLIEGWGGTDTLIYYGVTFAIGGALVGLIVGLVLGRVERLPKSLSLLRARPTVSPSVLGIGLAVGLALGLPFGFVRGLGYALAVSFAFTFLAALTTPEKPAESDRDPLDPLALWRADRFYWRTFGFVFGLAFAIPVSLAMTITARKTLRVTAFPLALFSRSGSPPGWQPGSSLASWRPRVYQAHLHSFNSPVRTTRPQT